MIKLLQHHEPRHNAAWIDAPESELQVKEISSVAAAKAISQLVALALANFSLVDHQLS